MWIKFSSNLPYYNCMRPSDNMGCGTQVPIIAPVKHKNFQVQEERGVTHYKAEFLTGLMGSPALIRNVAIAGHLHHGKTVVRYCKPRNKQKHYDINLHLGVFEIPGLSFPRLLIHAETLHLNCLRQAYKEAYRPHKI